MAKRRRKAPATRLEATVDNVGHLLGGLAARVDSWKAQRHELAAEIRRVSSSLLQDLGHAADSMSEVVSAAVKTGRRAGFTMSAEAKKKISDAAKLRWAAHRAANPGQAKSRRTSGGKAKRHFSPEARARLAAAAKKRWATAKKAGKTKL